MNSTGQTRAVLGGYTPPASRESCKTCANGTLRLPSEKAEYADRRRIYCEVFKTDLNLGGICPKYRKK